MGTNFAVAPGEYLQEWIDGNGSDGEHRDLDCSRRCFRDYFVLLL